MLFKSAFRIFDFKYARALLVLGLMCLSLWGFIEIADEVIEGDLGTVDEAVLSFFRVEGDMTRPIGPLFLEKTARDITALGSYSVIGLVTLATVAVLVFVGQKTAGLFSFLSVASGVALVYFLKLGFDRPRPELVSHFVDVSTASFPSGHSTMSFLTYLSLALLACRAMPTKRAKSFVIGLGIFIAGLVALSRVYLGVHWPSDVLAGGFLGVFWALLWLAIEYWWLEGAKRTSKSPSSLA